MLRRLILCVTLYIWLIEIIRPRHRRLSSPALGSSTAPNPQINYLNQSSINQLHGIRDRYIRKIWRLLMYLQLPIIGYFMLKLGIASSLLDMPLFDEADTRPLYMLLNSLDIEQLIA